MDIRNFFGPKVGGAKGSSTKLKDEKQKTRNRVISDSDSEEESSKKKKVSSSNVTSKPKFEIKKKRNKVISDSDSEDDLAKKPKTNTDKACSNKKIDKVSSKSKLKEVNAVDFFNSKVATTHPVKRKSPEKGAVSDAAFDNALDEVCFSPLKKQRTKSPDSKKTSKLSKLKDEKPNKDSSKTTPKDEKQELVKTPESKKVHNESLNDSSVIAGTPQQDAKKAAYMKYVSRGGAKNPGSKEVPEGSPNCFEGLVFVLTGVYDSLEREEMADIVKKLGGKVTTSVSKNTKYLVVGSEAGESKLNKANNLGTPKLTEDEFLDLIRQKSSKEKENKTPKTSPEKSEEKKVKKVLATPPKQPKGEKDPKIEKKTVIKDEPSTSTSSVKVEEKSSSVERKLPKIPKIEPEAPKTLPSAKADNGPAETELFVDKYKPSNCKGIIGQQGEKSNMNKLKAWLRDWNKNHLNTGGKKAAPKPAPWGVSNDNGAWAKCALLSGSPGVGKTTTAYLVAKELGYDIVEMNASDTRSKKLLGTHVSDTLNTTSVASLLGPGNQNNTVTAKRVLLMDEVDGMAGNEDRGGVAELISLIKTSKVPVIAMCNDRQHQKIRSLANYCFDLRFSRPRVEQIKGAMMSVCCKEKIPIKPEALSELITGCGQDVRQVLHHLAMVKAGGGAKMEADQAKKEAEMGKKTSVKVGPWDVCRKVFSAEDHKNMSFIDKSDLYFHDYNLSGLFVQENYLSSKPTAAGGDKKKLMELVSKAADSIATGDLVDKTIRSGMNWGLLSTAAVFSSVLPGEFMSGFLTGQIQFPAWLGKNSRRNKTDRQLQELQTHTRLSAGLSKESLVLEQSQILRDHILTPLVKEAADGVDASVARMGDYNLLREDLDSLIEVSQWPDRPDPMKNVESKTKAAFTRKYNKEGVSLPYRIVQTVAKKKASAEDFLGDEDDDEEDEDEADNDDVGNDAMIKMKKAKSHTSKDDAGSSKGKGKGGGKGKGKK